MACDTIDLGSEADCDNLPTGGTRARIVVFNYDDIEGYTEDANEQITAITLAAGATGYPFTGFRNDVKSSQDVIKPDTGIPKFKHTVGWVVYERTQIQKNNVEKLARGAFVCIVENKGKDSTSFEVVGKEVGVQIVAGPIRNAHENGGFFVMNLSTADDEGEMESKLPQTLLVNNYTTTLAYVDSLLPTS